MMNKTKTGKETRKERFQARAKEMYEMYESGATLEAVGEEFGISRERVRQIFTKAGYERRAQTISEKVRQARQNRKLKIFPKEILYELYVVENLSIKELTFRLRSSTSTISRSLRHHGIPIRSLKEVALMNTKTPELTPELLYRLYCVERMKAAEIGERFNYSENMIRLKLWKLRFRKSGLKQKKNKKA